MKGSDVLAYGLKGCNRQQCFVVTQARRTVQRKQVS